MITDVSKKPILELVKNLEKNWNAHDVKAHVRPFADDAEFTTVFGHVKHGKKTIEEGFELVFSTVFKNSEIRVTDTSINFVRPDVASVHIKWNMTGATLSDGTPWKDRKGLLTWIVVNQNERWEILIAHNSELAEIPPGFNPR